MNLHSLTRRLFSRALRSRPIKVPRRSSPLRPTIELLEDRAVPAVVTKSGNNWAFNLNTANEVVTVHTTTLNQYIFTTTGTFTGDLAGSSDTVSSPANVNQFTFTDSAAGTSVSFTNSTQIYQDVFAVTLDGGSAGVSFTGASSFGAGNFTVNVDNTINVTGGASLANTSLIGDLILNGNVAGTGTGSFDGVDIGGNVSTAGGDIRISGHGGSDVTGQYGVEIHGGVTVTAQGLGTVSITGVGGSTSTFEPIGVYVHETGTKVTSVIGAVTIDGTGGGTAVSVNGAGVDVNDSAIVTAGGAGLVTVTGVGGVGTSSNIGVIVANNGKITSGNGNVVVSGTGGGGAVGSLGVSLINSGVITASGPGTVSVTGVGNAASVGTTPGVSLDASASIASSGGLVTVTGTGAIGAHDVQVADSASIAGGGDVTLNVDSLFINSTATVSAASGAGIVRVQNRTAGQQIDLGGADVFSGTTKLGLTVAELNRIFAGTLIFGSANAGIITVSAAINPAHVLDQFTIGVAGGGQVLLSANVSTSSGASLTFGTNARLVADVDVSAGAGDVTFAGSIAGSGNSLDVNSTGVTTFTGVVGTSTLNNLTTDAGGTTQINGGVVATIGTQTFNDTIATGTTTQFNNGSLFAVDINATGNLVYNLSGASSISGTISGVGTSLTKQGAGTLTLSGTSTYNGGTTVSDGMLLVDGSISAGVVVSGGTLGGTGSIGGTATINTGGAITGGTLGNIGTLTVGGLSFNGGTYAADFNGNTSDSISTAGAINLANATRGVFSVNSEAGTATAGTEFALIDNTGGGAIVNPPLSGATEGGSATINGSGGVFSYLGGDGNNFTFTTIGPILFTLPAAGIYTLRRTSGPDRIQLLQGATVLVSIPTFAVTYIDITGSGGADTLTVDYTASGGYFQKDVTFDGGSGFDTLIIDGGSFGTIRYDYTNATDGVISNYLNPASGTLLNTIVFRGLSPLVNSGNAVDVVFNLPAGPNIATLGDDGISNQFSRLSSTPATFETTDFKDPNGSLTINVGSALDTLTVDAMPDFSATLTAGSLAAPFAAIDAIGAVTSTGDITLYANGIVVDGLLTATNVTLDAGTGSIATSGAGTDVAATGLTLFATTGIDLDTDATDLTATNSGAGNITIDEFNGVNVLNATAINGNLQIASLTSITVGTMSASGSVTLNAGTSILDDNNDATRITSDSVNLTAGVDIGQPLSGPQNQDIDTAVNSISASTTGSPNAGTHGIWIDELDGVTLTNVTTADGLIRITTGGLTTPTNVAAAGAGRNATVIASAGNIAVGIVSSAAGNVTLTATTGSIVDDNNDLTRISANNLTLTAAVDIGQPLSGAQVEDIDTAATSITASTTTSNAGTHGIWIDELDGVTLTSISTVDGLIRISTGGATTATNVAAAGAGRNATIIESSGNITVGTVSSAAGNVTLTATTGSIVDDNNDATRISANNLTLTAAVDIGQPLSGPQVEDIDTTVASITASTTPSNAGAHGIWIDETNAVTLTSVTTLDGLIRITAGNVTATNVVTSGAGRNLTIISTADIAAGTVTSTAGAAALTAANVNSSIGNTITTANGLTVNVTGTTGTLAGVVNGAGAPLTKAGAGTLTLAGSNGYTGTTTINAGALLVNGSITSNVVVNAAGTLGGIGTITGNVSGTGIVAPGNSPGVLTIIGAFTPGGEVQFEVNPPVTTAGADFDQIQVTGSVDLSASNLTFSGSAGLVTPSLLATLIANDGLDPTTPSLSPAQGAMVSINGNVYRIFYNGGDGNDVVLVEATTPATVFVDDSFVANPGQAIVDADLGNAGNQPAIFGVTAFTTIGAGLGAVASTGTVVVNSGVYGEAVNVTGSRTLYITGPDVAGAVTVNSLASASGTTIRIIASSSLTVGDATSTTVAGAVTDTGTLTKVGAGTLTLSGPNILYSGATFVQNGILELRNNGNGAGEGFYSNITLSNDAIAWLTATGGQTSDLHGDISGTGSVVKKGNGTVRVGTFAGLPSLTYSGNTTIEDGTLELQGQAAGRGFDTSGNLIVDGGATFALTGLAAQTSGNAARFGGLQSDGTILGEFGTPFLEFGASTATFDGDIDDVPLVPLSLLKTGVGTQTFTGANTYTGTTTISSGTLLVNNTTGSGTGTGTVTVGATLGGTGTIAGNVNVSGTGTIAPGVAIGRLTAGNTTLIGGSTLAITIANTGTAGTDYDQLRVNGTVNLGGSTLSLSGGYVPDASMLHSIVIVNNDGSDDVNGIFTGLPEGSAVPFNGGTLYITYAGGDGNDVVLNTQIVVSGPSGSDDALVLRQVSGDATRVEFSLNGAAFIPVTNTIPFTFNGNGGTDLLLVDTANGDPISTGGVSFSGEMLRIQGTGTESATLAPSAVSGTGAMILGAFGNVNFTGTDNVDLISLGSVQVRTGAATDTLAIDDGFTVNNGGTVPAAYVAGFAPAAALTVTGTLVPDVALRNIATVTVTTSTLDGADTVTLSGGTGAHGVVNFTIATGTGADVIDFAGSSTFTGTLTATSGGAVNLTGGITQAANVTVTAGTAITESGGIVATAGTLNTTAATGTTLTGANAIAHYVGVNTGGAVSLNNTIALNLAGITQTGGGTVSLNNSAALTTTGQVTADGGPVSLATTGAGSSIAVNALIGTGGGGVAVTSSDRIDLNAASKLSTTGVATLAPTTGVNQAEGSLGVIGNAIALQGSGAFALDNPNNDAVTIFRAAVSGAVTFRDANALTLDPLAGVTTGGNNVALLAGSDFSALNAGVVLVNAGGGDVRIIPGAGAALGQSSKFLYNAEVIGGTVTFGIDPSAPDAQDNRGSNDFRVTPSKNATIVVFGNDPTFAQLGAGIPGDSFAPLVDDPNITALNLTLDPFNPTTTLSGTFKITYADTTTREVKFRQIELLGNIGIRAIVVQTGPQQYSIRLQKSVIVPVGGSVSGQALESSPFVVSPNFVNPVASYSPPNLALGDINGDGIADLVIANGSNDVPQVTVINGFYFFSGQTIDLTNLGALKKQPTDPEPVLAQFYGFSDANGQPTFRGGLHVAVKSNGAGTAGDIVLGPGVGGGPVVERWRLIGGTPTRVGSFAAFELSFRGGVTVATGDYDNDGRDDIIVGTGPGGAPRVQVFGDGNPDAVLANFFAYDSNFRGGVHVAAGNFDGLGGDDIATAPGYGGGPHIRVLGRSPGGPIELASFFAWDPTTTNGLQTLGTNANNGVGSLAFGAPERLSLGVADPTGRQELLVSSARGTTLQMRRFTFAAGATSPKQTYGSYLDLFNELTVPGATDEFGTILNGIPILDPGTTQQLSERQLFDGGNVAGFTS